MIRAMIRVMEQSSEPKPWIGLFIKIILVIVVGFAVTQIILHNFLGIPFSFVLPLSMLVVFPFLYSFIKRFPTIQEQKPLSFPRWIFFTVIFAALLFVVDYLADRYL